MSGITSFLIARIWFGKAADDFNQSVDLMGSSGTTLVANLSNAFTSTFSPDRYITLTPVSGLGSVCLLCCPSHCRNVQNEPQPV